MSCNNRSTVIQLTCAVIKPTIRRIAPLLMLITFMIFSFTKFSLDFEGMHMQTFTTDVNKHSSYYQHFWYPWSSKVFFPTRQQLKLKHYKDYRHFLWCLIGLYGYAICKPRLMAEYNRCTNKCLLYLYTRTR